MDLNSKTGTGNIPPSMDMCELAPKFHSHRLGSASNSGLIHSYSLLLFTFSFNQNAVSSLIIYTYAKTDGCSFLIWYVWKLSVWKLCFDFLIPVQYSVNLFTLFIFGVYHNHFLKKKMCITAFA